MQQHSFEMPRLDDADLAACRALLADGSKTFWAASYLLPARVRNPATALYAFCRLADDAVDLGHQCADGARIGASLRARLDMAYDGRPFDCHADRAFAAVVARFAVPREVPLALLDGFRWDAEGRRYETFEELSAYAVRVAGTVGIMMAILMGARDEERLARACDLGVAMQLTNIARDVGEDARAGRLYLPLSWLREAGIDPEAWMVRPAFDAALRRVVERLLVEADRFYQKGESGIAALPASCRPGILAARLLYAEIGREVERAGCDSVSRRARVSKARKLVILGKALATVPTLTLGEPGGWLAAAEPLVAAASPMQPMGPGEGEISWWDLPGRFARVIELFDRLERQDMESRSHRPHDAITQGVASVAQ